MAEERWAVEYIHEPTIHPIRCISNRIKVFFRVFLISNRKSSQFIQPGLIDLPATLQLKRQIPPDASAKEKMRIPVFEFEVDELGTHTWRVLIQDDIR